MTAAVRGLHGLDGDHPAVAPPGREVLAARGRSCTPRAARGAGGAGRGSAAAARCSCRVAGRGNAAEESVGVGVAGGDGRARRVVPSSNHLLPEYMTATRSQTSRIRPRVVRDVDLGRAVLRADVPDEVDDPRLHRDVQRGGRLVEQQQGGVGEERHRDDRALLLSARELVGKGCEHARAADPAAGSRREWRRRDRGPPRARSPPRETSGCP